MTVHHATDKDVDHIMDYLCYDVIASFNHNTGTFFFNTSHIIDHRNSIQICKIGNDICGWCILVPDGNNFELLYFEIFAWYRHHGLGKRFAQKVINYCKVLKTKTIYLEAIAESIDFWKDLGFVPSEISRRLTPMKLVLD